MVVQTLGFTFNLYFRCEEPVVPGNIVHGVAWLFGDLETTEG